MTEMTCLSCTATTTNGLALCERCQIAASVYLEFFPVHFRNLSRWRPGRAGSRPVPSSREPSGVGQAANDYVSRTLDEAGAEIIGWARCLSDDRGIELPEADGEAATVAAACRMLTENLTSIATLEWAGRFVTETGHHEGRLRALSERVVPGWYAGGCRQVVGFDEDGAAVRCETSTYVVPGLTWVTCGGCGATTYARDHLETILDEAREWVARPKAIAETLVALLDTEQSVERLYGRIRKWESIGWLEPVRQLDADGDAVGPKRYPLGDVVDLVLRNADTQERMTSA